MIRRDKSILSLPAKRRETLEVALSKKVADEYRAEATDFAAWVQANGGPKEVGKRKRSEQLARMTKLRGLAAEGKIDSAVEWILKHRSKGQGPLVVMAHHSVVIEGVETSLRCYDEKLRIGKIVGGQAEKKRKADKEAFQRGEIDVMLCSIMAAGVGLTLTRAAETLFVERTWRPMDLVQAEDRVHRIGQTRPVTITYLDATGTIDMAMARMLLRKTATIAGVIEGEAIDDQEAGRRVFGAMFGHEQQAFIWNQPGVE
jgi:SWI/SNF-related matrix-associated actin-dependent regulator 1 of chromatin subfamily A